MRLHAPIGLNNGIVPPPLSAYTPELTSKTLDQEWDASLAPSFPHPPPSFSTLRLPVYPTGYPQSASMAHFYSPYCTPRPTDYYPSMLNGSLLAAAAAASSTLKTPALKFTASRGYPPQSVSPIDSDRRSTSIAALRLKAKEHSASCHFLSPTD